MFAQDINGGRIHACRGSQTANGGRLARLQGAVQLLRIKKGQSVVLRLLADKGGEPRPGALLVLNREWAGTQSGEAEGGCHAAVAAVLLPNLTCGMQRRRPTAPPSTSFSRLPAASPLPRRLGSTPGCAAA